MKKIFVDGRRRREENRKKRGAIQFENMIARYDSESHMTAHYFIDLKTGEKIEQEQENEQALDL